MLRPKQLYWVVAVVVLACGVVWGGAPDYEQPPINYSSATTEDPVAVLDRAVLAGKVQLSRHEKRGYLESLLRELKIPVSSQTLVFSKTSFQRDRISPQRPRAIYFNDDTYVGYVPGGDVIEIASTEPPWSPRCDCTSPARLRLWRIFAR